MFEEITELTYAIEKNVFIIKVQLCSKEDDEDYNNIAKVKNIVDNISKLLKWVTIPLGEDKLHVIEEEDFIERCSKIQLEKNKLFSEAISFLVINKKW